MHILLIEDDEKLCETLQYQLEQEQCLVDSCQDGLEGLHRLLNGAYSLAILDRMLPSMDGLTILQKARQQHIQTPVILLTALGELLEDGGARVLYLAPGYLDEAIREMGLKVPEDMTSAMRRAGVHPVNWEELVHGR